jgi:hypothetical protein
MMYATSTNHLVYEDTVDVHATYMYMQLMGVTYINMYI